MINRMMNRMLLFTFFCAFAFPEDFNSQYRAPNETFEQAARRTQSALPRKRLDDAAEEVAVSLDKLDFDLLPMVDAEELKEHFKTIRDIRFLKDAEIPNFARRISWLYPQDGCWIRAALFNQESELLEGKYQYHKVFIFGDLTVKTKNAPGGSVSWWYHVVPLTRTKSGEVYALDPAMNAKEPMRFENWAAAMGDKNSFTYSVCLPDTYGPYDSCSHPDSDDSENAASNLAPYLTSERANLIKLGRKPQDELGNQPPWKE